MKKHVINHFVAITAVAWLGQTGTETNTLQRQDSLNRDNAAAQTSGSVARINAANVSRHRLTDHSGTDQT
jgi:hypothetical protein